MITEKRVKFCWLKVVFLVYYNKLKQNNIHYIYKDFNTKGEQQVMDYEKLLNPEQYKAVKHNKGPLLILAGAGSGKTRVLTHRIAYLIDKVGVNPFNILALTFTNKAAAEMRERVDHIVGYGAENIWVSTFHSTCVRILRKYITSLGYEQSFTIYDSADQKTLIKEVSKLLDIDTKRFKEATLLKTD